MQQEKINIGDLIKLHPEFGSTTYLNVIEGEDSDATGMGIVLSIKDEATPPVTYEKECTVYWFETGKKTIIGYDDCFIYGTVIKTTPATEERGEKR